MALRFIFKFGSELLLIKVHCGEELFTQIDGVATKKDSVSHVCAHCQLFSSWQALDDPQLTNANFVCHHEPELR